MFKYDRITHLYSHYSKILAYDRKPNIHTFSLVQYIFCYGKWKEKYNVVDHTISDKDHQEWELDVHY